MRSSRLSVTPGAVCLGCIWLALDPLGLFGPFLLSAALHELGHWSLLRLHRIPVTRLRVTALGCVLLTGPLPYRAEARCALAGPAVNLLLFILTLRRSAAFALVNLVLAAFNLLPLWPLDGGRFLRALLWERLEPDRAQRVETVLSTLTISAFWLAAAYATCYLHAGLAPVVLAAALTLRTGREKLVAKKRA